MGAPSAWMLGGVPEGEREENSCGWAHVDSGPEPGEVDGALSGRPEKSPAAGSLEANHPEAGWWHVWPSCT